MIDAAKQEERHGTNLAMHAGSMSAVQVANVASANTSAISYTWLVRRLWILPPYVLAQCALLVAARYSMLRIACLLAVYAGSFALQVRTARGGALGFGKRFSFVQGGVAVSMVFAIAMTGGLASPLLVGLMSFAVGMMTSSSRNETTAFLAVLAAVAVLALGLAPEYVTGPPVAQPFATIMTALAFVFSLYLSGSAIVLVTRANQQAELAVDRLRQQVVLDATSRTRSLESITSKVAHELKNPLAAIKGLAQLLTRGEVDEKKKQRLDVITEEIARMEVILKDYLTFARPLEDLRIESVDLHAVAADVAAVMEARAEQAGITLTYAGPHVVIAADPRRIKEALLNLVANAIEATPGGGVVSVHVAGDDSGARVVVKDTGKGLTPEAAARIGTPFYSTRDGGTGLGVVVARAAIAQHGGDVQYDGATGRGTTVSITLPKQPPPARSEPHGTSAAR
jgi:signal transduction histidine kinase